MASFAPVLFSPSRTPNIYMLNPLDLTSKFLNPLDLTSKFLNFPSLFLYVFYSVLYLLYLTFRILI